MFVILSSISYPWFWRFRDNFARFIHSPKELFVWRNSWGSWVFCDSILNVQKAIGELCARFCKLKYSFRRFSFFSTYLNFSSFIIFVFTFHPINHSQCLSLWVLWYCCVVVSILNFCSDGSLEFIIIFYIHLYRPSKQNNSPNKNYLRKAPQSTPLCCLYIYGLGLLSFHGIFIEKI